MCKLPARREIKGNEFADKAAKNAIGMIRIVTIRLPHTEYYRAIKRTSTPNGKKSVKAVLVSYTASNLKSQG